MADHIALDPADPRLANTRKVYDQASEALLSWWSADAERAQVEQADPRDPAQVRTARQTAREAFDTKGRWEVAFYYARTSTELALDAVDRIDWDTIMGAWAEPYRARVKAVLGGQD